MWHRPQSILKRPSHNTHARRLRARIACVVHGITGRNIGRNDAVLIIGAGPIGLLHLLLLRLKGARVMINVLSPYIFF